MSAQGPTSTAQKQSQKCIDKTLVSVRSFVLIWNIINCSAAVHGHTHSRTHIHKHTWISTHTSTHTSTHSRTHTRTHAHTRTQACTHARARTHGRTHAHTHTRTQRPPTYHQQLCPARFPHRFGFIPLGSSRTSRFSGGHHASQEEHPNALCFSALATTGALGT